MMNYEIFKEVVAVKVIVQSVVNTFGSSALAGYSAGSRIESLAIVPLIAMGNAISTFTAQNLGAGQVDRVQKGYRAGVKIVGFTSLLLAIIIALFHRPIVAIFLDSESSAEAFRIGIDFMKFIGYFLIFLGLKSITDGVLRGAGDMRLFTISNLTNLSIRCFVAFKFSSVWGIEAIWYAIPMGWTANFLISFSYYKTGRWKDKNLMV